MVRLSFYSSTVTVPANVSRGDQNKSCHSHSRIGDFCFLCEQSALEERTGESNRETVAAMQWDTVGRDIEATAVRTGDRPGPSRGSSDVAAASGSGNQRLQQESLHAAATRGDLSAVDSLLAKGLIANARAGRRRTALMVAAQYGHLAVCESLLASGSADPTAEDSSGNDALYLCKCTLRSFETRQLRGACAAPRRLS